MERRRAGKTPPAPLADRGAGDTQMNNLPGKCRKNLETAFINIYFRKFPPPNPPASPCRLGRGQSPSLPLHFSGFPPGLGLPSPSPISAYLSAFSHSVLFPQVSLTSYRAHPTPSEVCVCTMNSSSLTPISRCFPCGSQPQVSQRPHLLSGSGSDRTEQP